MMLSDKGFLDHQVLLWKQFFFICLLSIWTIGYRLSGIGWNVCSPISTLDIQSLIVILKLLSHCIKYTYVILLFTVFVILFDCSVVVYLFNGLLEIDLEQKNIYLVKHVRNFCSLIPCFNRSCICVFKIVFPLYLWVCSNV